MRTMVTVDDALCQRALEVADPGMNKSDLFREAMQLFVRVQAGKRLAALGGTLPDMKDNPRRRAPADARRWRRSGPTPRSGSGTFAAPTRCCNHCLTPTG